MCDHKQWLRTREPETPAKEGKRYGSKKESKEKEEITNKY
jgi:hypothetical protein